MRLICVALKKKNLLEDAKFATVDEVINKFDEEKVMDIGIYKGLVIMMSQTRRSLRKKHV